jgi:hypothetical protein
MEAIPSGTVSETGKQEEGLEEKRMEAVKILEPGAGFEPHSVAGSALKLASRLLLRGPAPSHAPHEGLTPSKPLSWVQIIGAGDGI